MGNLIGKGISQNLTNKKIISKNGIAQNLTDNDVLTNKGIAQNLVNNDIIQNSVVENTPTQNNTTRSSIIPDFVKNVSACIFAPKSKLKLAFNSKSPSVTTYDCLSHYVPRFSKIMRVLTYL